MIISSNLPASFDTSKTLVERFVGVEATGRKSETTTVRSVTRVGPVPPEMVMRRENAYAAKAALAAQLGGQSGGANPTGSSDAMRHLMEYLKTTPLWPSTLSVKS